MQDNGTLTCKFENLQIEAFNAERGIDVVSCSQVQFVDTNVRGGQGSDGQPRGRGGTIRGRGIPVVFDMRNLSVDGFEYPVRLPDYYEGITMRGCNFGFSACPVYQGHGPDSVVAERSCGVFFFALADYSHLSGYRACIELHKVLRAYICDSFFIQHNHSARNGDWLVYPYPKAIYVRGTDVLIRGNKLQELGPPQDVQRDVGPKSRSIGIFVDQCRNPQVYENQLEGFDHGLVVRGETRGLQAEQNTFVGQRVESISDDTSPPPGDGNVYRNNTLKPGPGAVAHNVASPHIVVA
jgi:hypothetical protein